MSLAGQWRGVIGEYGDRLPSPGTGLVGIPRPSCSHTLS